LWYVAGQSVDWEHEAFKFPDLDPKKTKEQVKIEPLDPILLPRQLNNWAKTLLTKEQWEKGTIVKLAVDVVVSRAEHPTDVLVRVPLAFDPSYRFDREAALQPNSPQPLSGLGLAYWVEAVVDDVTPGGPAEAAGVKPGDLITAVRFKMWDDAGNLKDGGGRTI
jgi:regulator of sigma E protease